MIIVNIIGLEFRDIQRSENSNFKTSELQNMGCFVVHSFFIYFFCVKPEFSAIVHLSKNPLFQAYLGIIPHLYMGIFHM